MEDPVSTFVRGMLDSKEWSTKLDGLALSQLERDLQDRLMDQINRAIIDAMPNDKIDEFNRLLDDKDFTDEKMQEFIIASGVDVQHISAEAMLRFRDLYLDADLPEVRDQYE